MLSNGLSAAVPSERLNNAPTKEQRTDKKIEMTSTSDGKGPQKSASPRYPRRRYAALPLAVPLALDSPDVPATACGTSTDASSVGRRRRRQDRRISTQNIPAGIALGEVDSGEESSSDDMSTIYITSSEEEE